MGRWVGRHSIIRPFQLVNIIQSSVYDEWVHLPRFGGEAGDTIATLFRGAEFKLEEGFIARVDDGEVVGHCSEFVESCRRAWFSFEVMLFDS